MRLSRHHRCVRTRSPSPTSPPQVTPAVFQALSSQARTLLSSRCTAKLPGGHSTFLYAMVPTPCASAALQRYPTR